MTTAIQIRNEDAVRDIRLLANLTGRTITDVVGEAVRIRLAEAQQARRAGAAERWARIREIQEEIKALPKIGPLLTDDDLYAEDGLPK